MNRVLWECLCWLLHPCCRFMRTSQGKSLTQESPLPFVGSQDSQDRLEQPWCWRTSGQLQPLPTASACLGTLLPSCFLPPGLLLDPSKGMTGQGSKQVPSHMDFQAWLPWEWSWHRVGVESSQDTFLALEFHCGKSP